jgi:hypothetical protein
MTGTKDNNNKDGHDNGAIARHCLSPERGDARTERRPSRAAGSDDGGEEGEAGEVVAALVLGNGG